MIEPKTILILGAGASQGYGYPTNDKLVSEILAILGTENFNRQVRSNFRKAFPDQIESFIDSLHKDLTNNPPQIIDNYIIRQSNETKFVLRMAISNAILNCEKKRVVSLEKEEDWYSELYKFMIEGIDFSEFGEKNNISFISFNYDRSLEQFFYESLINDYGRENHKIIKEQLAQINIHHIHGKIADLPWENDKFQLEYGTNSEHANLADLAKNIEAMNENVQKSAEAQSILDGAEFIYFIGFGYHLDNLRKLDFDTINQCPNISGTCQGLGRMLQEQKKQHFNKIKLEDTDASYFIKEYFLPIPETQ